MTKRAGKKYPQDPHQFYREPRFTIEQAFASFDFGSDVIWDASCGTGNILNVARANGHHTFGSDIVDRERDPRHPFRQVDFLKIRELPFTPPDGYEVSLFCNPPYGKVAGIGLMGEKFVKHALEHFSHLRRLAFVLPIEFVCSESRYWDIYSKRKPSHNLICCQRPTMPPGLRVEEMGNAAFKGGMSDYCILVWTRGGPYRCETVFMRPQESTRPPSSPRRIR